jgi:GNAT superfamily N-acetyltransferase
MAVADLEYGLRLSRASGWNQTLADWRLLLALGAGLFRVGVEDGRVVACGGAVRYGAAVAWICMILVDPARRGRGLGTRAFDEVLLCLREAGTRERPRCVGLDATPAGRAIYLQRGFVDGPGLVRMVAEAGPLGEAIARAPAGPAPGVRPLLESDLPAVLAHDREVFGADRSLVLREALASAPRLARVASEGGRVRGYCLGRHGDHSDHVGPVVADGLALARDLVAACAPRPGGRPVIVDARAEPTWTGALEALGFRAQRPFTRMYLGGVPPASARPSLEPAVRGPEFA